MPPSYGIREGLHWCLANDRLVFLDLPADRYFCVPPDVEAAFRRMVLSSGTFSVADAATLSCLSDEGLLIPNFGKPILSASAAAPVRTFRGQPNTAVSGFDLLEALIAQTATAHRLRTRPLSDVVSAVQQRKARRSQGIRPIQPGAVAAYLATRRILSTTDRCLRWSIALADFLARRGAFPDFIIGVRMAPFLAHAWIQDGDEVLNDDVDHVSQYSPILVI